jgi:hypothetical protein
MGWRMPVHWPSIFYSDLSVVILKLVVLAKRNAGVNFMRFYYDIIWLIDISVGEFRERLPDLADDFMKSCSS